jgi:HSP20 family molecular chaperone IbpA
MEENLPEKRATRMPPGESQRRHPGGLLSNLLGYDPLVGNMWQGYGMEVTRTEDGYTVEIPVPGYKPGEIDVTFQDDMLVVSGRSERRNFTRSLVLPDEIDPSDISASVAHGMLTLRLGRRPETKPRRIAVQ